MSEEFLYSLNAVQKEAVLCTEGPVMVLAGAGSGKTRVLTYRIANLIAKGVNPNNILALTFTNKAANEMKERIEKIVGNRAKYIWMGTFHSVCVRIIRNDGENIGFSNNFSIYDTDDSKNLIKTIVKEMSLDDKLYNTASVLNRISFAKMNLFNPEQYAKDTNIRQQDSDAKRPLLKDVYSEYWNRCKRSNAMDFDDLLYYVNMLFHKFPDILNKYQENFHYILVDEYQDTNYAQYLILKRLAELRKNICVVGDDAQSIYGFRGANIENILNFNKDYPKTNTFKLEQNYRSSKHIVAAANSVIQNNRSQLHKIVWTSNEQGEPISLIKANSESEEALSIANSIFHTKMTFHIANSDFAVLYRTNAQSRAIEEALRKSNLPYKVYGGMSFYKRKEVKDLIAYFRLVINPNDNEAFYRIVNFPARGIGNTTLHKISTLAESNNLPVWTILSNIEKFANELNAATVKKLKTFHDMISRFQAKLETTSPSELAAKIAAESGMIKTFYEDQTAEGISRYQNIEAVLNAIRIFEEDFEEENENKSPLLSDYLQNVSLLTTLDENDGESDNDKISLMTIHSAKGLEFPYVYVAGLEENLFPSSFSIKQNSELEEERRLFYVAITRSMKKLTLSFAETRYRWGEINFCEQSRFIDEIDEDLFDTPTKFSITKKKIDLDLSSSFEEPQVDYIFNKKANILLKKKEPKKNFIENTFSDDDFGKIEQIAVGMKVEHSRFGKGVVEDIDGNGQNKKAIVNFDEFGQKNLVLRFARLKILN